MVMMGMGERGRLDLTFRQAKLLDPSNYGVHITVYPNALMVVIDDLKAVGTIQPKLVSAIALEELSKLLKKCCRFFCGNVRRLVPTVLVSPSSRKQKYIEQCDGPIGLRQHVLKKADRVGCTPGQDALDPVVEIVDRVGAFYMCRDFCSIHDSAVLHVGQVPARDGVFLPLNQNRFGLFRRYSTQCEKSAFAVFCAISRRTSISTSSNFRKLMQLLPMSAFGSRSA